MFLSISFQALGPVGMGKAMDPRRQSKCTAVSGLSSKSQPCSFPVTRFPHLIKMIHQSFPNSFEGRLWEGAVANTFQRADCSIVWLVS